MSDMVYALDSLAAAGVIDFDAPAFIFDQPSRYVGHPDMEKLPLSNPIYLPENIKLKDVPSMDEFTKENGNLNETPSWKKWLFGGTIAAVLCVGIYTFTKGKIKLGPNMSKVKTSAGNLWNKIKSFVKKPFEKKTA